MKEAVDWLERYRKFWEQNFGVLDALLEELKAEKKVEPVRTAKNAKSAKRKRS